MDPTLIRLPSKTRFLIPEMVWAIVANARLQLRAFDVFGFCGIDRLILKVNSDDTISAVVFTVVERLIGLVQESLDTGDRATSNRYDAQGQADTLQGTRLILLA